MHRFAWIALAVLPQASEVERQAARITGADGRATFDAISRLVDLAATSREAVEAAASKLPDDLAFYREALREELKAREGAPRLKRASFEAKEQSPLAALNEITAKFGEKLDLNNLSRGAGGPVSTVTVKLQDASYMEALDSICRQAKATLYSNGATLSVNPFQQDFGSFHYRNYLVLLPSATLSRRIEFGGGETRSVRIQLNLFWDSEGRIVRSVRVRVAEAIDGNGKPVATLPEEPQPAEPARKEGDPVANFASPWNQYEIALAVPDAAKISRVRGFYEALASREASDFEFKDLGKDERKSDDHYEVEIARKTDAGTPRLLLRVKPKGSMETFLKTFLELRGWVVEGQEVPVYTSGRLSEGWVDYPIAETTRFEVQSPQRLKGLRLRIHRVLVERRIPFEFADIPLK